MTADRLTAHVQASFSAWFDAELMAVHAQMPQRHGGLLMGCPIWGKPYIERMVLYTLATLAAERNVAALSGRCWMVFYTTTPERPIVWQATRWLRQVGVHTLFRELPGELATLASKSPTARYALLAAVQNILAHMAGHAGMGLHMWMPDHPYSERYFERLGELGTHHEVIVQQSVSTDASVMERELERRREPGGAIAIPGLDLNGLAVRHMHRRSAIALMDASRIPDRLPSGRQLLWIGRDALHVADVCRNLVWVCPELCLDAPADFLSTLDVLAPNYIRGPWCDVSHDPDMAYCELSPANRVADERVFSRAQWTANVWEFSNFTDDYTPFFERRIRIPISEQAEFVPDGEIERQHQWAINVLRADKTAAMEAHFREQFPPRFPREPEVERLAADD